MSRTLLRNLALSAWLLVVFGPPAFAQSFVLDQLTTFREPANIMVGAIAKLPDGRIYGFYTGGYRGGIYQSIPNGSGGYTAQVVYEFTATGPGLPGQYFLNGVVSEAVEAGADGRVYFASADGLARFDPNANTVERLHPFTTESPVSLTIGIDGVTVFGGGAQGALFSYNTLTGDYRDIGNAGGSLVTAVQMKDGNLLVMNYEIQNSRVVYRKTDPSTGVELAAVIFDRSSAIVPVRADDGEIYGANNVFGDKTIFRLNAGCFCFTALKTWLFPNAPFIFSVAGRAGSIYFSSDNKVQRLNTTVVPPVVEPVTDKYDWNLQMMSDGTLMMFNGEHADGLNTATFTPGTDSSYPVAYPMAFDGVDGLPEYITEGADGMLYGTSGSTHSGSASIFRIDPATRTHALVQHLDFGVPADPGYGIYTQRMVLAPNGKLFGVFNDNTTPSSGIFSYDPATNVAAIVKTFPVDPATGLPGAEGGYPENLVLGRDGWIYGDLSFGGDQNTYNSALFKFDPSNGTTVTIYAPTGPDLFYASGPMVETAPGVWNGAYNNNDGTYCGILFRFDANTQTFTSLKGFVYEVEGCGPSGIAPAPGGKLFVSVAYGGATSGGALYSFNPQTNALSLLKGFDSAAGAYGPSTLWIGADGELYGQLIVTGGVESSSLYRFDLTTGQPVILAQGIPMPGYFSQSLFPGHDGRFYAQSQSPYASFAVGIVEKLPVAPASGPFGGTTTVSATLKAIGVPIAGQTIAFTLNGHAIGSATTNSAGVASLNNVSLNGIAVGVQANAIGASFAGNDRFPAASGSGALTVIDVPTPGLMIGEGVIRDDDAKYEFGFIVRERANGADRGGFVLNVSSIPNPKPAKKGKPAKPRDDRFVARSFTSVVFSDDPTIRPGRRPRPQVDTVLFAGNGEWNGQGGYRFEAFAQDRGEPGRKHHESLRVVVYNAAGQVVVSFDDELSGGNVESVRLRR